MDLETFQRAVDALEGFSESINIIGGEPLLHPRIREILVFAGMRGKRITRYSLTAGLKPTGHFAAYREQCTAFGKYALNDNKGVSLWTSLPSNYYNLYEDIHDNVDYQMINDHNKPSRHQSILISRRELNIPDEEWLPVRDNCWVQRQWMPSITYKGIFFCEIAASLDMLLDGPGGWPIEKDWWKRRPEDWREQLKWCEYCAMPIFSQGRDSDEETDDISPLMLEKLKKSGNYNLKDKKSEIISISQTGEAELKNCKQMYGDCANRYLTTYGDRFSEKKSRIHPKQLTGIICSDSLQFIEEATAALDRVVLFTSSAEAADFFKRKADLGKSRVFMTGGGITFGRRVNKALAQTVNPDWFIILKEGRMPDRQFRKKLFACVLNPGTLYLNNGTIIFNCRAHALKSAGADRIALLDDEKQFADLWEERKICKLRPGFERIINPDFEEWVRLTETLSGEKREVCMKKLDYIRGLILVEYYKSYVYNKEISFQEKLFMLNGKECLSQLYIQKSSDYLKIELKAALKDILDMETLGEEDLKEVNGMDGILGEIIKSWDCIQDKG